MDVHTDIYTWTRSARYLTERANPARNVVAAESIAASNSPASTAVLIAVKA